MVGKEPLKRVRGLTSLRERQRDQAGAEVQKARRERDRVEQKESAAKLEVAEEMRNARVIEGDPVLSEDLALAAGCVRSAREEVNRMEGELEVVDDRLNRKKSKLLSVHRQVKQMDLLSDLIKGRIEREIRVREQREMDDLAIAREVRK